MFARLLGVWDRFWFSPMTPVSLAVARWVTGGYSFWFLLNWRHSILRSSQGSADVFHPIGVTSFLNEPLHPATVNALLSITIFLAGLFTVGVWHRVLAPLFAGLFLFVLTYSNSWAMVFHTENMLVLQVLILAITPSASVMSLDASYTQEQPKLSAYGLAHHHPEAHFQFRWPIRVLQLSATLPYVVAGAAKLKGGAGLSWANGENLRDQITMNGLYYEVLMSGAEPITFRVYGWDTAFMMAATMTLVLEMGAPLALLHRYAGYAFVAGIMSMHWSILILMGIPFPYQLWGWAFVCFFEWDKPVALAAAKIGPLYTRVFGPS